jgi:hypothetical protein
VAYLTRQIDAAIASATATAPDQQAPLHHDLAQARTELENVLTAIRQGLLTPATKTLLDHCERCEAALRTHMQAPSPPAISLPTEVARYLTDLRAALNTDVEAARVLLAKLIAPVVVRRDGTRLVAETEWNLEGVLGDNLGGDNRSAGRGILHLPQWPPLPLEVA